MATTTVGRWRGIEPYRTVEERYADLAYAEQPCRCAHKRVAHQHFRRGSDCSWPGCACARFRRPSLLARVLGR